MSKSLKILVIESSVRRGRLSPRVAAYVMKRLAATGAIEPALADLGALNIPVMEERLGRRDDPPAHVPELGAQIAAADGMVIVTPEYNHGYPGALKNALDYFMTQFKRKPVLVITVSAGAFGGVNCYAQLATVLIHMGALVVPATVPVSKVQDTFTADGDPTDPTLEKRFDNAIAELTWLTTAVTQDQG